MTFTGRVAVLLAICAVLCLFVPIPLAVILALAVVAAAAVDAAWVRERPQSNRSFVANPSRGRPTPFELDVDARPGAHVRVRQPTPPDVEVDPSEAGDGIDGTLLARR